MYKLTKYTNIVRLSDSASIPNDPANKDYAEYLEWLSEGGIPELVDPEPIPIPAPTLADQILGNPDELAKLKKALGL